MRFKTKHPDGDSYAGIVTHIKPGFIVLREEEGFELDGMVLVQTAETARTSASAYSTSCGEHRMPYLLYTRPFFHYHR